MSAAEHGSTPAAWSGVTVSMAGFVLGGVALMLNPISMVLFYIGLALTIAGLPLYWVMRKMGLDGS